MTITVAPARNELTANAGQTIFNYTFKIFSITDLNVYITPAGQNANDSTDLTTDYTVLGVGDEDGGTITLTVGATLNDLITIVSNTPSSRTTDYQNNGDFRPDTVNADFDRIVSLVKKIEDITNRGLLSAQSKQGPKPLSLPEPVAGKLVKWKSDLTGLENTDVSQLSPGLINDDQALFSFSTLNDALASTDVVIMKAGRSLDIKETSAKWDVVTKGTTPDVDLPNGSNVRQSAVATLVLVLRIGMFVDLDKWELKGSPAVETTLFQAAVTFADTNRLPIIPGPKTYLINDEITINDYINIVGKNVPAKESPQSDIQLVSTTPGTVLFNGSNIFFSLFGVRLSTNDPTIQLHLFRVGVLGDTNSQNSSQGNFSIHRCVFKDCGGTALQLGGETYGTIGDNCVWHNVAQALAVNGNGEITISDSHFEKIANSNFTAGANNLDAYVYIEGTVAKFNNCVGAFSEDFRETFRFSNCGQIVFFGNKMEAPGKTTMDFAFMRVTGTAVMTQLDILNNNIVASSATGTLANALIRLELTQVFQCNIIGNALTYGPTVDDSIPLIDVTGNPRNINISGNHSESANNALIKLPEGTTNNETQLLGGLKGDEIRFITVTSKPFTILQNQTNKIVPFGGRDYVYFFDNSMIEVFPVSMLVQGSTTIGGVVTFKYSKDTSNSDVITLPSTNGDVVADYLKFALRNQYVGIPDQVTQQSAFLQYTSDGTVSTSVEYIAQFTYAVITAPTARFTKFMVDIG